MGREIHFSKIRYVVIAIVLLFTFVVSMPFVKGNVAIAEAEPEDNNNQTIIAQKGIVYPQLSGSSGSVSIKTGESFTINVSGTGASGSIYRLRLYEGGSETPFPAGSTFQLINYSSSGAGSSKIYRMGINVDTDYIYLDDLSAEGGEEFEFSGTAFNFQIVCTLPLSAGSYRLYFHEVASRSATSAIANSSCGITVGSASGTTFSLSATKAHTTVYTDSTERITLNITPSNSTDNEIRQKGRGVRVKFNGATALPNLTKVQLFNGTDMVGDDNGTSKSFAFSTTEASTIYLDLTLPSNALDDGTYNLIIELFTEEGDILGTTTLALPVKNIDFKSKASTLIDNGSGTYSGIVYSLGVTQSVKFKVGEQLPDDATVKYSIEKRSSASAYSEFANFGVTNAKGVSVTAFRNLLTGTNSDEFQPSVTFEAEGVYRFKLEIYDRNGHLKHTSYSYLVCAKPSSSSVAV